MFELNPFLPVKSCHSVHGALTRRMKLAIVSGVSALSWFSIALKQVRPKRATAPRSRPSLLGQPGAYRHCMLGGVGAGRSIFPATRLGR
jgi:hypothetical protein